MQLKRRLKTWTCRRRLAMSTALVLLRQEIASSGVTVRATLREHFFGKRGMSEDRQERFAAYVEALAEVIGHADWVEPLHDYCLGLLLPGERKSVEPIAAVTAPARVSAKHQSLLHFVANAAWSNERVLRRIQELTLPIIEGSGAIEAWIIDDTGFPKKDPMGVWRATYAPGE